MPQNLRTRSVALDQAQYEQVQTFPRYVPAEIPPTDPVTGRPQRRPFALHDPMTEGYRVVTCTLRDGRTLAGVLCIHDDLLVPETEPAFSCRDILALAPTPPDAHPDFTITDPDALSEAHSIENGNLTRLAYFGPPQSSDGPEALPYDEAWEEALDDDRRIDVYPGDLPAAVYGIRKATLGRGGYVAVEVLEASRDDVVTHRIRPQHIDTWRDLLRCRMHLEPGVTLADLMAVLALSPSVDREVYVRCTRYHTDLTFAVWRRRILAPYIPADTHLIETLEVYAHLSEADPQDHDDHHWVSWSLHGMSAPLTAEDCARDTTAAQYGVGQRIAWGLDFTPPARLRHLPLRLATTFTILPPHEEQMAFYRRRRAMSEAEAAVATMPVVYTGRLGCSWQTFLGAIFDELRASNRSSDLLAMLRDRVAEARGGQADDGPSHPPEWHQALAILVEPLEDAYADAARDPAPLLAAAVAVAGHLDVLLAVWRARHARAEPTGTTSTPSAGLELAGLAGAADRLVSHGADPREVAAFVDLVRVDLLSRR